MKNITYILLGFWFLTSCTPDPIEVDIPQAPQRIVVASQQIEGNTLVIVLSRSFTALENKKINIADTTQSLPEELLVKGADVTINVGGVITQLEELSAGVYFSASLPGDNFQTYLLNVTDNEKQQHVVSQAMRLPKVMLDTFGIKGIASRSNEYLLHYAFTDNPNEQNWYVINFYTRDNASDSFPGRPDVDYIAKRLVEQRLDFDLVSEKDLVNGKYQITKKFTSNKLDTFGIALSNISEGYFQFLAAQQKLSSVANKIRGEIINMPTNVQNGYGYFNMHTPDARAIRLTP